MFPMFERMHSFVPSVGPCMHHNYWCDFKKAYIPWLPAAYNFGCRALYNLPWRASVSSYQVQCNIPTFEALLKKCVSVSWTMRRVQQCMVARFAAVRLFIPVLVLIIWTLQPCFILWLSARTLQCWFEDVCRPQTIRTSPGLSQVGLYFLNAIFTSNSECSVVPSVTT